MAKAKRRLRLVAGVIPVRTLPSVREIEREYRLDRETWTFWTKPWPGNDRIVKKWNESFVTQPAGKQVAGGYVRLRVKGQSCAAHRLIWKIVNGRDPKGVIDHINGIRDDNRIENLRDVTPAQNAANAIRDRWAGEKRRRRQQMLVDQAVAQAARRRKIEERERATLARLKAKYEPEKGSTAAPHAAAKSSEAATLRASATAAPDMPIVPPPGRASRD